MRRFALLAAALLAVASLASAGGQKEAGAEAKKRIVHYHWTETVYDKINQAAADKFMSTHPNVEVKLLLYSDQDRATKIRTTLAADGEIDSFALYNAEAPEFLLNGQVVEIIPAAFGKSSLQEVRDMWNPGSFKSTGAVWEGKYYGIPFELSNYAGWINTRFMKEAGLNPVSDIPKTWADFVSVAKKMTVDTGGVRSRNGFGTNTEGEFIFELLHTFAEQKGLDWPTEAGYLKSLDTPEMAEALKTFTDFVTESKIWDTGLFQDDREAFGNGLTATFLTGGTWYWGVLDNYSVPREDVTPFRYPRFPGGKDVGGVGYGYAVYVSRLARDPKLTFEWLNTMTSQPNEFIKYGYFQPRKSLDQSLAAQYIPKYEQVFRAELATTAAYLATTKFKEFQDATKAAFFRVIYEGVSVKDSLKTLKKDAEGILK
jgi:multiple sugar transport system substrate-binding protein